MSSVSSSNGSMRGPAHRPSTPDQIGPMLSRTSTYSVAPKSEFLRNALEARRAQNTPTPSLQNVKSQPPPTSMPLEIHTPKASPDVFDEFALTEEQTAPVSPIRRRTPSDVGLPRSKTNRELTNEIQKLKETLMTSNMRVELLKKDNRELQHDLTAAKEQVERLEPLEDENYELRAENKQLKLKLDKMSEQISNLQEDNEEQRRNNMELTAIASESAAHFSEHETALAEAAECIIKMEEEKALLDKEYKMLKERVMVIESHSPASTLVDTPGKYPPSVYSVDEERPTTSHFDSDYYSQAEDSPYINPSSESVKSFTPSERSKKFLDLTEERRRSARDLSERMSAVSLKALREASLSPTSEVPEVPATFQQQIPTIIADDRSAIPSTTPVPHRQAYQPPPRSLMDAADISPARPHTVAPQSHERQPDGLRGLYRPRRTSFSRKSSERRPSSYVERSSNAAGSFFGRQQSTNEASPHAPSRTHGNRASTTNSDEHLQRRTPLRRTVDADRPATMYTPHSNSESMSSGWEMLPSNSSPPVSNASTTDLTSVVDPREDKDGWWRSLDRLTLPQALAQQQQRDQQTPQPSNHATGSRSAAAAAAAAAPPPLSPPIDTGNPARTTNALNAYVDTLRRSGSRRKPGDTTPLTALNSHPVENDFLFNAKESEDDFLRKTRSSAGSSSRRS
ncbi:hypothetical protein G6011_05241 [Alternaria panax]|uniref:Centrosomin N-terminal motif 1 domain-containing protein n=1 Tax=Alternaria panax TaxID=48097 RepID=A0AAD4FDE9_9PLEO|nr:hypothetical protein G6011_05241 [Alternaria panax]